MSLRAPLTAQYGPMKEVILHVGLNKTGTQSLQETCVSNRGKLHRAGITYPIRGNRDGNHSLLLEMIFGESPAIPPDQRQETRERCAAQLAHAFTENATDRVLMVAVEVAWFSREQMTALREWFSQQGYSIRVICYIRHLASWTHSMVAQRVVGRKRMTIDAASRELAGGLVQPRIENLKAVFDRVEFRGFEQALQHSAGPQAAFFELIGVDHTAFKWKRANERASDCAVRASSVVNETLGSRDLEPAQVRRDIALFKALREIPGEKFLLRAKEAPSNLIDQVAAEQAWLAETFGDEFRGPPLVLGDRPQPWKREARQQLAEAALRWGSPQACALLRGRFPMVPWAAMTALH